MRNGSKTSTAKKKKKKKKIRKINFNVSLNQINNKEIVKKKQQHHHHQIKDDIKTAYIKLGLDINTIETKEVDQEKKDHTIKFNTNPLILNEKFYNASYEIRKKFGKHVIKSEYQQQQQQPQQQQFNKKFFTNQDGRLKNRQLQKDRMQKKMIKKDHQLIYINDHHHLKKKMIYLS